MQRYFSFLFSLFCGLIIAIDSPVIVLFVFESVHKICTATNFVEF